GWQGRQVRANQGGPPPGLTGAPGESDCASSGCHTGNDINSNLGALIISGLPAAYRPDQEINLTVTLSQPNRARYGFQLTALDGQGRKAGELLVADSDRTQKITTFIGSSQRDYIFHTGVGTAPSATNQSSWTMRWKAPSQSVGRVTFHASGNAANGNGAQSGDFIYVASASMQSAPALPNVASVSAASFTPGALAPETITAAFGSGLSQNIATASAVPLPTTLDGTQIIIRDAFNVERSAPLFFVSPNQVNYMVPQGLFPGAATVFVRRNNDDVAQGLITVETFAPALFAANSNGQGVAAAVVLRVRNGQQSFEPVSRAEGGSQVAVPIDLGTESDQVYLLLFGTGFRGLVPPATISVTVGGTNVSVLGYAAVEGFAGLDQCNVGPLPRGLAGRGNVNIVMTAGFKTANTLSVNIK
ncbi:MAG: choice-of-anchor V domain-containing protein, partial [Acidobacteriota bacterium]